MLLAGAVREVPGIAIPVRLHWVSCQHPDQVASQAACPVSDRSGHGWRIGTACPVTMTRSSAGVDVDEQFAGPAEVFTLPHREPGGCSDAPQDRR
jgi:hypothetical protein